MCNMCPVIREHSRFPACCECVSCRLRGSVRVCVCPSFEVHLRTLGHINLMDRKEGIYHIFFDNGV